jgi:hypothetical protein
MKEAAFLVWETVLHVRIIQPVKIAHQLSQKVKIQVYVSVEIKHILIIAQINAFLV